MRHFQIALEATLLAKLLELFVLEPRHDAVERVDLLTLPGRHQPGVLGSNVESEDGVADLEAGETDGESAAVARRRLPRHAATTLRTLPRAAAAGPRRASRR